jgi:DNA-binding response OmpR family regulator
MTANAFESDRRICLDAGMNDHIGKPVEPALLFQTVLKFDHAPAAPAPRQGSSDPDWRRLSRTNLPARSSPSRTTTLP